MGNKKSELFEVFSNTNHFKNLLKGDRIADRVIFMKGIDYSYYYEQEE